MNIPSLVSTGFPGADHKSMGNLKIRIKKTPEGVLSKRSHGGIRRSSLPDLHQGLRTRR